MIVRLKKKIVKELGFLLIILLVIFLAILGTSITSKSVIAGNVTNATVIARVNITNIEPNLYKVKIDHPLDSNGNINLEAGNATTVICNGSFQDLDGYDDIINVSATLYDLSVASDAADDNNTHYTNTSCGPCTVVEDTSNQNGSCLCQFAVQYYANPSNWQCNMTINDSEGIADIRNSSFVNLNEILGIDVETTAMDYGNLTVTQISDPTRQNVTNMGNIPINVTVRGFGGVNESIGQNVTMICGLGANITFGYQRYDIVNDTSFADMNNLTNQTVQIPSLKIPKRTSNSGYGNSSNSTFWMLEIPSGAGGICNGTIIFGAIDALNN